MLLFDTKLCCTNQLLPGGGVFRNEQTCVQGAGEKSSPLKFFAVFSATA